MQAIANASATTKLKLIHGDCLVQMQDLPAGSIDVTVTSPPYNLGIKYGKFDDTKAREDYLRWSVAWCREVKRLLRENGSFFLNVGASPSNPMFPHELVLALRDDFVLQNTFHWIKSITVDTRDGEEVSVGHFKPINSQRYVTDCHEYVFHLTKTGSVPLDRLAVGVVYADKSNIARWGAHGGARPPLPRQQLVHPVSNHSQPRRAAAASRDLPGATGRVVHQAARTNGVVVCARSVPRHRQRRGRGARLRREGVHRDRN